MRRANQNRLVWLLPFVALAAGYAIGYVGRPEATPTASASRESASTIPRAQTPSRVIATRALPDTPDRVALPPMPSDDLPLADAFDTLAARARGGDGPAAVRLLDATLHCARLDGERALVATMQAHPSMRVDPEVRAQREARARAFIAANESLCAGATQEQVQSIGEWLPRAAASGDPGSQACYAELGASENWLPEYASDAWIDAMRRYRENAGADAEASFAAGVPQSAYTLYELSAGRYAMMTFMANSAVLPDYPKAYALALFQSARFDAAANAELAAMWRVRAKLLEQELSAADIERGQRWSDAQTRRLASREAPTLPCEGWIDP